MCYAVGRTMRTGLPLLTDPLQAALTTARQYNRRQAAGDALAGLTVACVAVPQSVAYAILAGVPPVYGLYTVIIQSIIGAIFNSQPLLSVGPMITQSLLVASTVTQVMATFGGIDPGAQGAVYLQLVIALTLMKGVLQIGCAAAHLGALVQYVSISVIVGFTAGAGVLIAAGQVNGFLGFDVQASSDDWPGLIGAMQRLSPQMDQTSGWAVALGAATIVIVLGSKRLSKLAPGPLIALVATAAIVAMRGLTATDLTLVGELPAGLQRAAVPQVSGAQLQALLPGAAALAVLGLMESYAIGKSLAVKTGTRIDANQELFSQGLTNTLSSFFGCIPGSGSFSRSALNHYAGAQTRFASIFNGVFVLIIFLVAAPLARFIPKAALAGILFIIAYQLIDWRYFLRVARSNRRDAAVCAITFFATLLLPLAWAIHVGIMINIALYVQRTSRLHVAEMVRTPAGPFIEKPIPDRAGNQRVMFLGVEGELFFGVADELEQRLSSLAGGGVRVFILRLKRTHSIDSTVLQVLERFAQHLKQHDGHLILCGVREDLLDVIQRYGLNRTIGDENIFETGYGVFTSAKRALARAQELVDESIDVDAIDGEDDLEGWSYEI